MRKVILILLFLTFGTMCFAQRGGGHGGGGGAVVPTEAARAADFLAGGSYRGGGGYSGGAVYRGGYGYRGYGYGGYGYRGGYGSTTAMDTPGGESAGVWCVLPRATTTARITTPTIPTRHIPRRTSPSTHPSVAGLPFWICLRRLSGCNDRLCRQSTVCERRCLASVWTLNRIVQLN